MPSSQITAIIFIISYIGIIFTTLPKVKVDRPSAAFFGVIALIAFGIIDLEKAVSYIDYNTIALLIGMMIIIAVLELDGFFSLIVDRILTFSRSPFSFLVLITFLTGIASAFLVNDAVVLLFTPIIIKVAEELEIDPKPFLFAEIFSANIGSAMTITGNPQNMLVGLKSGITYSYFFLLMLPISIIGMFLIVFVIRLLFRNINWKEKFKRKHIPTVKANFTRSIIIFIGVVILFFIGHRVNVSIPLAALIGAALILLLGEEKPSKIIKEVDWVLLVFFASLFILVHAVEDQGLLNYILNRYKIEANYASILTIHGLSLFLSQILSNVPYCLLMFPLLKNNHNPFLWLSLASSSTLAGNATIIGAMANLIVIESADKLGVRITFKEFLIPGIIITILSYTISLAIFWIYLNYNFI
ncbi:MAG TPA: SLC13 family permease [Ignavibacteriales bacterium]|nr:SLC13 family permease [Ignavibacteriales bacterium]HPP34046.1 SLC13 family permease [Ignavibacteriales bacterium]HRT98992.1 SLC13 family permease [Ignavibacteriales bacterium]